MHLVEDRSPGRRLVDFVFLTRPPLLCVSTAFFFAGCAAVLVSPLSALRLETLAALAPSLLLFVLIAASSFVINQVFDVKSDRLNEKNFLLHLGRVSRREAVVFHTALSLAALLLGTYLGPPQRELCVAGLLLGLAYSVPPVRLKGRPLADMLANGLGFGFLGFALGWLALRPWSPALVVESAPYVIAMCAIFLNTTIPDENGDREAGDRTSCVVFGRGAVAVLALLMLVAAAAAGFLVGQARCAIAVVASLPAFFAAAAEPTPEVSVLASQFAGRAFFIIISIAVPPLGVLGAVTYGLSRIYYARRLGLDYPRLAGASARGRKSQ